MNNKLHLFILVIYQCLGYITSYPNPVPLVLTGEGHLLVEVFIGSPPQSLRLKLLTTTNQIMVKGGSSGMGFDLDRSETVDSSTTLNDFVYQGRPMSVRKVTDHFNLGDYNIGRISFGLITEEIFPLNCHGILGLGYNSEYNSNLLLLDYIKDLKLKIFTVQTNTKGGNLFLGDFNHLIKDNNKKLYWTCPLINVNNKNSFYCFIDSVYINMNKSVVYHQIRNQVGFNMGTNAIVVSEKFFDDLVNHFFRELIDENICTIDESGTIRFVSCRGNQKPRVEGKISFVVGKWSLSIDLLDLYDSKEGSKISKIICDVASPNQWVFGTPLLSKYTIIFNREELQLGFIKKIEEPK